MTAHGGIRALVLASAFALFPSPAAAQTVHDGSTVLVSRPSGDAPYTGRRDGTSDALAVSADGRYVVFVSSIDEIADGVNLEEPAVLPRDRVAQTTVLVGRSDGAVGAAASTPPSFGFSNPTAAVAVASAGSVPAEPLGVPHVLVAFSSNAGNLVDHATGALIGTPDAVRIWLRDVTAATTTLVSRGDGRTGAPFTTGSTAPSIDNSPAGPLVAFARFGLAAIVRVVNAARTVPVGCQQSGCGGSLIEGRAPDIRVGSGPSGPCTTSGPCVSIALTTSDPSYATGGPSQVVLFRTQIAGNTLTAPGAGEVVSRRDGATGAIANAAALNAKLSSDATSVGFTSTATNLTADPGTVLELPYVRNLATGRTILVAKSPTRPNRGLGHVSHFSIGGAAGALPRVLFPTAATNLAFLSSPGTRGPTCSTRPPARRRWSTARATGRRARSTATGS